MGEVWLARDVELDENVALKLLHARLGQSEPLVELLKAECKRTRALLHPNIVRLFDFHRADDRLFLSMEYLGGGDIARFRGASPQRLIPLFMPVIDALSYAHHCGIVHRDLKASNVLLDESGAVKLADFGIAGVLDNEGPGLQPNGGGSPRSVSPQQLAGAPPDPRDDVYSLGILIRDLLVPAGSPAGAVAKDPDLGLLPAVSAALATVIESMVSTEPATRPASMERVKSLLAECVLLSDEPTRPPAEIAQASPVEPISFGSGNRATRAPSTVAGDASSGRPPGQDRKLLAVTIAAFLFLGAMAVGVFWYLPRMVQERAEVPEETPQPVYESARAPAPAAPLDRSPAEREATRPGSGAEAVAPSPGSPVAENRESLRRTKLEAEEALDDLVAKRSELEARGVEEWGAEVFAAAQTLADEGDQWFLAQDYPGALESYRAAIEKLDELTARAPELLADLLREGAAAIESGDAETAIQRYELALRLEAGNAEASQGLEQARKLEQVNKLVAEATELEQAGRLEEAGERYRDALAVDPEASVAVEGAARVEAALTERAYQAHMSEGLTALEARRYDEAGAAFEQARKLRPKAAGVNDALVRLRQAVRRERIAKLRARANALEGEQRWKAAADQFRAALAIDSTLVFAQQGAARTSRWARFDSELSNFLANPERLYSKEPYERAVELLHDLESGGALPRSIEAQTQQLARLVALAGKKVQVSLISDLQTDVVVYRVGKLGRFERRDLQLRPGVYTVVGSCVGYRDVRHTIRVEAEGVVPPLVVRCEEKI